MPNIKSAKKRVLVIDKKTQVNKAIKSALKTQIKKFLASVEAGNKEEATKVYSETVSAIDSAASKGILHKNNAANKKAKLAKKLNAMA
jgi:small subunit ribosomal protein S20